MPTSKKIFQEIMSGSKDQNIRFSELQKLLDDLNFHCRIKGDHFIYYKNEIDEITPLYNFTHDNQMTKARISEPL